MADQLPTIGGDAGSREALAIVAFDAAGAAIPSSAAADTYVSVTKANTDLVDGTCRGLLVGTAGTANLQDATGTTRTNVPLQQGYNPLRCKQVRTGGTAADIWALY